MKVQLLSHEAKFLEAMKYKNDLNRATLEIGVTREAAYFMVRRLVRLGVIRRTGHKMNYRYEVLDTPFDIVKRRTTLRDAPEVELDQNLKDLMESRFTPDQLFYYKHHRNQDRRHLASKFGMTKAQLNFAIINAGLGSDKLCVRQK